MPKPRSRASRIVYRRANEPRPPDSSNATFRVFVVKDTPPGIKGATATNQLKEATLETGLKTRVPPFINIGETVRVSTEDGSYLSRA